MAILKKFAIIIFVIIASFAVSTSASAQSGSETITETVTISAGQTCEVSAFVFVENLWGWPGASAFLRVSFAGFAVSLHSIGGSLFLTRRALL